MKITKSLTSFASKYFVEGVTPSCEEIRASIFQQNRERTRYASIGAGF